MMMAAPKFDESLAHVLISEGGYSNHPRDPGGVTLEGVIQRVYDGYRDSRGLPRRRLTPHMRRDPSWIAERNEIYRLQYWDVVRGDEMPPGIDVVVFDGAVNSGPRRSIIWLQAALGVQVDGNFGEATMAAVLAHQDHDALVADILERRMAFLQGLRTWPTFGRGWTTRVSNLMAVGQAWATGSIGPAPEPVHEQMGDAKAYESDIATAPVPVGVGAGGSAGAVVASESVNQVQNVDAVQAAIQKIAPVSYMFQSLKIVLLVLTLVGLGVTLWGVYRNWRATRIREAQERAAVPAYEAGIAAAPADGPRWRLP